MRLMRIVCSQASGVSSPTGEDCPTPVVADEHVEPVMVRHRLADRPLGQGHRVTVGGQPQRRGPPDPAPGAGHERHG